MTCLNNNNNNSNLSNNNNNSNVSPRTNIIREKCCIGQTGCSWSGNLDDVVLEPVYVQKIYDAALFNLQGISFAHDLAFSPRLPAGSTVVGINFINITKFFDPTNSASPDNFRIKPETVLQGAQFVQCDGQDEKVVGPDGKCSQKIIYIDTSCCDALGRGTPVFGSQNITIQGLVRIDMEVRYTDENSSSSCPLTQVLTAFFPIKAPGNGGDLVLTNFFELCVPSVFEGAFFPRFAEICNALFTGRLMTNNLIRDVFVTENGTVRANIIISICVSCEKKILVPAQLCVLSTGFTQLSPETGAICPTFPSLFPRQIDENSIESEGGNNGNNSNSGNRRGCCS